MDIIHVKFDSFGLSIDGDWLGMYASYKCMALAVVVITAVRVIRKFHNK